MNLPLIGLLIWMLNVHSENQVPVTDPLPVRKCRDFALTGMGSDAEWNKANWNRLTKLDSGGRSYETRFKIMYSSTGIYLLFAAQDDLVSTKYDQDFQDLFKGDVCEVFFHTDTTMPVYFEYEINALNKEIVLLVPNFKGRAYGWFPYHYTDERQVKKMVHVEGGKQEAGASVKSWTAELFFPYVLFTPLVNVPPTGGTIWNANFCRLDYDSGAMVKWAWAPVDQTFHEFRKFKEIRFEP